MPDLTIRQMTDEIREVNIAKGFRPAEGGPGDNTWGDYIALLHSEVSEALEAYRDHRLADATAVRYMDPDGGSNNVGSPVTAPPKPEGVGSEFADILIRLIDMADVFGWPVFEMDLCLPDVEPVSPQSVADLVSFGDWITQLHGEITQLGTVYHPIRAAMSSAYVLRTLVAAAQRFGIDLTAEYTRKIAYNRTRAFQHGGRTLADGVTNA